MTLRHLLISLTINIFSPVKYIVLVILIKHSYRKVENLLVDLFFLHSFGFSVIVKTCRKLQWAYFIYSGAFFPFHFSPKKYVNGYNWIIGVYFFGEVYGIQNMKVANNKKGVAHKFVYTPHPNKLYFFCWN